MAFTHSGDLVDRVRVPLTPPYRAPHPGWAEQDPQAYWDAVTGSCRMLWAHGVVRPAAVRAVALTTQRATVINLDAHGRPLRPAILWLDQRRADRYPSVGGVWKALFTLAGLRGTLAYLQAEAEANWLWANQPDLWRATARYLLLSGYLTHRLSGRYVDSVGCQVGYIPFDYRRLTWCRPSDWKWQAIPVRGEMLPDLVPPGRPIGEITTAAARETGLPAGLPVVAAASDKACEVLGAGGLEPSVGCIGYGTTATISVTSRRYLEPVRLIPPYPSALPGAYNLEVQVSRGMWLASWFAQEFGHAVHAEADREGIPAEAVLDRLAGQVPAGSRGLVLQPYWAPGVRFPGPEARGAVVGFTSSHTRADLYRATLEGLAYAMREGRERIERRTRVGLQEVRVCGGGATSDLVMQITADVLGLPAVRPHVSDAAGLGAAILAATGIGMHDDIASAVRAMTRVGSVFHPGPARAVYDHLYRDVYRRLYQRLRPLYQAIRAAP